MSSNCDYFDEHDILLENSIVDADTSFMSEPDIAPQSCNIDLSNGFPLMKDDFHVVHYNINSITANDKLEQLQEVSKLMGNFLEQDSLGTPPPSFNIHVIVHSITLNFL